MNLHIKKLTGIKLTLVLTVIFCIVSLSGCTRSKQNEPNPSPPASKQPLALAVYYLKASEQDEYLVREVRHIPYTTDSVRAAAQEVISGQPLTKGAERVFPPSTKILGVKVENGLATVNFSREVLKANQGSAGEALAIQSMVNTLTEFPEVRAVSFQVEGKLDNRTKDWWGHVGLYDQPFQRNLAKVYEPRIWVTHPTENQVAGVPLLVKGSAMVFEGTVNIRLLDKTGEKLAEGTTTATEGMGRGEFEYRLTFKPPSPGQGKLEVFWASPEDGRILDKVTVPVRWQ
ncbi:MAG TPA: spore gernimation protein [Desulfotomaculum sp.]|nr:spore gernimation protein [Desulfotomaculum sp.]